MLCGIDLGRSADPTVLAFRQGNTITEIVELKPHSDMTITQDEIEAELYARGFRPRAHGLDSQGRCVLDCSGLGAPIWDWMRQRGWNVGDEFLGGSSPRDGSRYANTRAESMWQFKRLIEDGDLALPPDEMLIEECTAIQWSVNNASKTIMEKKDVLRVRLGRSIDRLDACSMSTYTGRRGRATVGGNVVFL